MEQARSDAGAAPPGVRIHLGALGGDEALELAIAHALLRRASAGHLEHAIRIYRPPAPAVVFGRRDTRLPGFQAARAAAVSLGFAPFVRVTGGRAVAYTSSSLVVDDGDVVRAVLERVYADLEQPFDPASVGSLADERPGVGVEDVAGVIQAAYGVDPAEATAVDADTRTRALELRAQHLA